MGSQAESEIPYHGFRAGGKAIYGGREVEIILSQQNGMVRIRVDGRGKLVDAALLKPLQRLKPQSRT